MKIAAQLFALMCINYGFNTVSIRLAAGNHYVGVVLIDGLIAFWGFTMVKLMVESDRWLARAGYVLGGMVGSAIGMGLTQW